MMLEPRAVERLASRLPRGSVAISATNGKTTTATLTAAILRQAGVLPVHNRTGANLSGGVATALLIAARGRSGIDGEIGVFEIDEGWLRGLVAQLDADVVLMGALFRDQRDRLSMELDRIAAAWTEICERRAERTQFVLNADDPILARLGHDLPDPLYFGIADPRCGRPVRDAAADARHCANCGGALRFTAYFIGHLSHYECPACGWRRPEPQIFADRIVLDGPGGTRMRLSVPGDSRETRLRLAGVHGVYNALGPPPWRTRSASDSAISPPRWRRRDRGGGAASGSRSPTGASP